MLPKRMRMFYRVKKLMCQNMFQVLGSCSQPLSLQDTQLIKVPQSDFSCAEDTAAGTSPWVYAGLAPAILLFFVVAGFLLHRLQLSMGFHEILQCPFKEHC